MYTSGKELLLRVDRLLNDTDSAAKEAARGTVLQNSHLALLDVGNTVIRSDYAEIEQVRILSGGESGHEPLYNGFVGKGFLTAAVQGDIFVAPPSYHIANVIKELAHKQDSGVLVIIQNNPSDNLNFGVAVEKAQSAGVKVMLLIVTDDCSDVAPSKKTDQPRGLTGVLLVQKIAGALTEMREKTLLQIYSYCEEIQKNISTVILTLKPCMSANDTTCICKKHGEMHEIDIGGGLHGECGSIRMDMSTTERVAEGLLQELSKHVILDENSSYVIMINNLCVSKLEETIFVGEVLSKLAARSVKVVRLYLGTFMTSLDMKGFTVTVMSVDDEMLKYLDFPTNALAWNSVVIPPSSILPVEIKPRIRIVRHPRIVQKGPKFNEKEANILLLVLQFACDALISCERQLNIMDAENGDGDTGTRMRITAEDILENLRSNKVDLICLSAFFKTLSTISEKIGGTLAALYGIMFEAAGNFMAGLDEQHVITSQDWLSCLFNVTHALKSFTKTEEGSNNMLAPLTACAIGTESAMNCIGLSGIESFAAGVMSAEKAADSTKLPGNKYPDSGAHAVHIWMRAILEGVKFRCEY